jgi:hypothetical protein
MLELLRGAYEMHIHTSPDVGPRKCSDLELARRFAAAGLAGALIKCHYADTAPRAALLNEQYPNMRFYGGVTLNNSQGALNPAAVESCGKMGGRIVWFPTMDALSYRQFHRRAKPETPVADGIAACDEGGSLLPQAAAVIAMAKKYGLIVATGHIGAAEGLAVARECARVGVQTIITHADNPADFYTIEQQKEAVSLGAVIEHCYFTTYYDRTPANVVAEQIRAVGVENVILSTDFGQPKSPYSDEGLEMYANVMREQGFSDEELAMMFRVTPEKLLARP